MQTQKTRRASHNGAPPLDSRSAILAMEIREAAAACGMSRSQFYKLFLKPGRVRAIKTGSKDRIIDRDELVAAYKKFIAESPRSGQEVCGETAAA